MSLVVCEVSCLIFFTEMLLQNWLDQLSLLVSTSYILFENNQVYTTWKIGIEPKISKARVERHFQQLAYASHLAYWTDSFDSFKQAVRAMKSGYFTTM